MVSDKPKFFGRRKGRIIRKAKSFLLENFLPRIRVSTDKKLDLKTCFPEAKDGYCLEIGFGDGEHLASLSQKMSQFGFIGVEVYQNGVANLLSLITGLKDGNTSNLENEIHLLADRADNVRVYDDDVRLLFSLLPDAAFDKVYLLFPDPWPKTKHAARRFINHDNLQNLARIIKKGGILQIATDHPVYKTWTLETMRTNKDFIWTAKTSNDWRYPPEDWCETKYQRKAIREGRKPVFFEYRRL
ncbi:MAG: tRNA (guanosine(46)-N7)-methyltransferase TrmB [Alphaproteobacteria bacterium]|nr:tRNA (guanosine(46)-N7)-methyltransferase TrmB [Alphaproteobacteria bacterium]